MIDINVLLKDWVLDEKSKEAQAAIFANTPEFLHARMDLHHKLSDFFDKAPRNPIKLFEALGLPVDRINVDSVVGTGFKRKFKAFGKEFSRPELVAKEYYEAQGNKVTWSEGAAFGLALDCMQSELADRMKGLFCFVPRKPLSRNPERVRDWENDEKFAVLQKELEESAKVKQDQLSAGGRSAAKALRRFTYAALIKDKEIKNYHINTIDELKLINSIDDTLVRFDKELEDVVFNSSAEELVRWLPEPSEFEGKDQRAKWNYSEWSFTFARELLGEFPRSVLFEYIKKTSSFSSFCFDLTAFNAEKGQVGFIEVKLDDKLTDFQLMDLQRSVVEGIDVRLAQIVVPK